MTMEFRGGDHFIYLLPSTGGHMSSREADKTDNAINLVMDAAAKKGSHGE